MRRAFDEEHLSVEDMMAKWGYGRTTTVRLRQDAGLKGQKAPNKKRGGRSLSRHRHKPMAGPVTAIAAVDAALDRRTVFTGQVGLHARVLVGGVNSSKIGRKIVKGRYKGWPIYTLTLEERATCPRECKLWFRCYGNRMHLARRWQHGPEFEERLMGELADLSVRHKRGFAVRLHVLGDFYSVDYVDTWRAALEAIPHLFVFGFTARDRDPIGAALRKLAAKEPRFAMRFSGEIGKMGAITVAPGENIPQGVVMCPQQQQHPSDPSRSRVGTCGQCSLCWTSDKPIGFWTH